MIDIFDMISKFQRAATIIPRYLPEFVLPVSDVALEVLVFFGFLPNFT